MANGNPNPNPAPVTPVRSTTANRKPKMPNDNSAVPVSAAVAKAASPAKEKRAKVRLVSSTIPGLWVRAFVDVIQRYGMPKDPNGVEMQVGPQGVRFGMTAEERERRAAAKEAEKQRLATMSEEERLEYARKRRAERDQAKQAKKMAERNKLIAEIKAELLAAGELKA